MYWKVNLKFQAPKLFKTMGIGVRGKIFRPRKTILNHGKLAVAGSSDKTQHGRK